MEEFRLRRCQEILRHAGANVPYYQRLFRQNDFAPDAFSDFSQLAQIPVLTRSQLIASLAELRDPRTPDRLLTQVRTGGTTGTPVTVYHDKANALERMLVTHRMYATMGRPLGVPTMLIAGSPIDYNAWNSLRDRIKNAAFRVAMESSFELTSHQRDLLIRKLKGGRYRFVMAYVSVFDVLCSHLLARAERLELENIIACAELVTEPQRQRWQDVLGARVFEIYGSREAGAMAGQIPEGEGLLINGDLYHLEITDFQGRRVPNGTPGMITLTSLLEHGMPLIRYQLGDVGGLLDRPPGAPYPFERLRITHGRVLDVIRCPDGKVLPGEFFPHLMKERQEAIERFQVVQVSLDQLVVNIVKGRHYDKATTAYLMDKMQERLGRGVRIELRFVPAIETSASGKYRPTISLLRPDDLPAVEQAA